MKLNIKLSILIGGLAFIIALFVGEYAKNISKKELEKNSGESLIKLSKNIADILDREMLERYREIEFAAKLSPLIDENSTKEQRREFIEKLKGKHEHHEWIGYALPDGTVDVGTNGYLEGKNVKARPWLPEGLKGPYIGDVHDALLLAKLLPNNSGEAIYFTDVAFPVKNNDGKVLGVLCTHLMWQWTRNVIRSIEKEHDVDIFLLSKDGMVLVGPNNSERKYLSDISNNVFNAFSNNKDGYKIINWKMNKNYLTAHIMSDGFEEYKGFGWKVIVRQSIESAFENAKENSNNILLVSVIAGLLGALIGIVISTFITSPLNKLTLKVKEFSHGKKVNFESKGNDDISLLEKALEELNENLTKEKKLKNLAEEKVNIALKVFDQSLEGIIITNNKNEILLINEAFTKITGYTLDDVYLKNPSILTSNKHGKEFYENMWTSILESGKWDGTITNKRKDGTLYDEYLKISTLKDEKNQIVNYLATFNSGF